MPALGSFNLKLKQQVKMTPFTSAMQPRARIHSSLHLAQRASATLALRAMALDCGHSDISRIAHGFNIH